MKDRPYDLGQDSAPIGGATLREHSRNIARRADELVTRLERNSALVAEVLFGPMPHAVDEAEPNKPTPSASVHDDLGDLDKTLNRLSNALDLIASLNKRLAGGPESPADYRRVEPYTSRPEVERGSIDPADRRYR